jgi:hypothetical protein
MSVYRSGDERRRGLAELDCLPPDRAGSVGDDEGPRAGLLPPLQALGARQYRTDGTAVDTDRHSPGLRDRGASDVPVDHVVVAARHRHTVTGLYAEGGECPSEAIAAAVDDES